MASIEYAIQRLTTDAERKFKDTHTKLLKDATNTPSVSMYSIIVPITYRMTDKRFICCFKALSLIHFLMIEGNSTRILNYLASNIDILSARDSEIRDYRFNYVGPLSNFLRQKVILYIETKVDYLGKKTEALEKIKSLNEIQIVKEISLYQDLIEALTACSWNVGLIFLTTEMGGVVIQQSFKMVIVELVALFLLINEAMVRMLSLFFKMRRPEAQQAVDIYKRFTKQIKKIEEMFDLASRNEYILNIRIPAFDIVI